MSQGEELVVGVVEAIFFENPSNFYKVVRISVDQDETDLLLDEELVITGMFASLHLDTEYQFFGKLTNHPKYGEQFAVTRYQQKAPTSYEGLVDYLSSSRFKGIGKVLAERIVDELGQDAIDTIISDSNALKDVTGLSKAKAEDLREGLLRHQGTERIFMQLSEWGFGPALSDKIYRAYESETITLIKENPYKLIEDVDGIGFNKADELAEQLDFDAEDINRIVAGIYVSVLELSNSDGDTYVPEEVAKKNGRKLLESSRRYLISDELLERAVELAVQNEQLMRLVDNLMIPSLYYAELNIVKKIDNYYQYEQIERFEEDEIDEAIEEVVKISGINYDESQRQALKTSIQSPISVITGGPGTGKTTLIKGIILLHSILHDYDLEQATKKVDENPVLLAAPTGRAAKRMQETTGLPASTIHRLIGYNRDSQVDEFYAAELDGSLLIVDEMSMVDTWLMNWLVQAIPYHLQVVLVGDKDQLPSVGPGKVFSDLIESDVLPVLRLEKIYRQAQNSTIIDLAHKIRQGFLPEDFLMKQHDRSFIQAPAQQIGHVVQQIIVAAKKKGFDATNLQVLAPMYKGPAGINALNTLLQELLNPPKPKKREINHFDSVFRVGDKVLQLVNNSEDGVYNGDIGRIEAIHFKKETASKVEEITVSFDNVELIYKKSDLDQLTLAYCTSIHKAQGSEYPLVILPLVDMYSRLLQKDILYTAITRAQSSLIMLGNPDSFYKAVTSEKEPRKTFLRDLLMVQFDKEASEDEEDESEENSKVEDEASHQNPESEAIQMELEEQIEESLELKEATINQIDPMINMDGVTPYDFMSSTN
ncbi:ATP-dependent RecD-like DNA helicase [Aerococcaceae bacterium INB8]|uniref:ATP-dependent RecD2 DNA helicase n=1 Tax=Ruoffia halotolerans TaxID=2748684 RepID=A0A839A4F4_9LACT|nr:ATP-dependent RecD-like DNA helicase [Ruoffia halotolerans]MBA5729079.1 ATP-dependent RecD-like DNA helicase [Ruoffia halotolerans]